MTQLWLVDALIGSFAQGAEDHPATFHCSARGGRDWREYRSKHFLVGRVSQGHPEAGGSAVTSELLEHVAEAVVAPSGADSAPLIQLL